LKEEERMNRFLVALLLLVVGAIGLGFYLGWFRLSTNRTDQKTNITITIDQDKIREDEKKAKDKVQEAGQKVKTRTGDGAEKSEGGVPHEK
jgi:hypothetical protein